MTERLYSLAIETSSRVGSVSLGRGEQWLAQAVMPPQERHRVDLLPTVDQLCREHHLQPRDIGQLYVSIGPGSFTGLRIGLAAAQTLAMVLDARITPIPTLLVTAANLPHPADALLQGVKHVLVCLNMKKDTVYAGLFAHDGTQWQAQGEPGLGTLAHWLEQMPRPLGLLGHPLPAYRAESGIIPLPAEWSQPSSRCLWQLGWQQARAGQFIEPAALLPLYGRLPEAQELWEKRMTGGTGVAPVQ